MSDKDIGELE